MYMNLITESYVQNDPEAFAYYSRFYIQHLYWSLVKATPWVFEEWDIDDRLKATEFHIETSEHRQAFRAFLELVQREAHLPGMFKFIHNTQKEEQEAL